jgi:hypothetical protein
MTLPASGYYRVEYSSSLLAALIEQLHANHSVIDVQTRSQLIDDTLNLAFAGYSTTMEQALNLTLYLANERELFPWVSFLTNMATPYAFFARTSAFTYFKVHTLLSHYPINHKLLGVTYDNQPHTELHPFHDETRPRGSRIRRWPW